MVAAKDFLKELGIQRREILADIDRLQRRIAFEALTRIIRRTPVDTGRARLSWTISRGAPDRTVHPPITSAGRAAEPNATALLRAIRPRKRDLTDIWISNNLDYIGFLENGTNTRPPVGMVAITLAELESLTGLSA